MVAMSTLVEVIATGGIKTVTQNQQLRLPGADPHHRQNFSQASPGRRATPSAHYSASSSTASNLVQILKELIQIARMSQKEPKSD